MYIRRDPRTGEAPVCPLQLPLGRPAPLSGCVGKECAAWRWADIERQQMYVPDDCEDGAHPEPAERPEEVPPTWKWQTGNDETQSPSGWMEPAGEAVAKRPGYCGLAGPVRHP